MGTRGRVTACLRELSCAALPPRLVCGAQRHPALLARQPGVLRPLQLLLMLICGSSVL